MTVNVNKALFPTWTPLPAFLLADRSGGRLRLLARERFRVRRAHSDCVGAARAMKLVRLAFWLGVLGPTATWLMRRLAAGLDHQPDGYQIDLASTAHVARLLDAPVGRAFVTGRMVPTMRRSAPRTA